MTTNNITRANAYLAGWNCAVMGGKKEYDVASDINVIKAYLMGHEHGSKDLELVNKFADEYFGSENDPDKE